MSKMKERTVIMDLKHLQTFIVLVEKGGVIKTSMQLNYSQSSVTKHIQALEKEFQVRLFETNKSKLTPAGECLYHYAKKTLAEYDTICKRVKLEDFYRCSIRVAGLEQHCYHYFMPVFNELFRKYPDTKISISTSDMEENYHKLREDEADFAIIADYFISDTYERCLIGYEDVVILIAKETYERDHDPKTILERCPIFVHQYRKLNYHFFQKELEHPHVVECNSPEVIYESVLHYNGIGVVGTARYEKEIEEGSVLVLETLDSQVPVELVVKKTTLSHPLKKELFQMFIEKYRHVETTVFKDQD